jgi:hypothetical protein
MLRQLAPSALFFVLLAASSVLLLASPSIARAQESKTIVGPSRIYFADADTVFALATKEWISGSVRHQEKLLRYSLRINYWRQHIPADMRRVFDDLGYPTGRVLALPTGHTEESWYYGQLTPPLRFRDGVLLDEDRFDTMREAR